MEGRRFQNCLSTGPRVVKEDEGGAEEPGAEDAPVPAETADEA
jgi:hypothetical protein